MKAIRVREFGGPEVLRVEELPDPVPGPGEVVVRVHAVGVNPVDTYIRAGGYRPSITCPYTPGSDAGGVVESVGPEVTAWKPGERVYTSGTASPGWTGAYAERALCRANQVHALPESLSFAQGAAVNIPYATAYRALLHRAAGRPGETVLVHGASGGVGTAAVQIARAHGFQVIGTAGSERGAALVRANGAHHVLDHAAPGYLDQVMALTGGRGADVILEMLANSNLARDLTILAVRGRVVVIGSRGPIEINPRETMIRDASILGMVLANMTPEEKASVHAGLGAGLANGSLRPVIGRELALAEAPKAHEAVMAPGAYGKIVLLP